MSGTTTLRRGGIEVTPHQADIVDSVARGGVTVVGAGAGSGKTHTLVATVLDRLEDAVDADRFVVITFTNKAADELVGRLDEAVRERVVISSGDTRRFWVEQQERLSAAYVGTIHSFGLRLLRTYGYEYYVPRTARSTLSTSLLGAALEDALEASLEPGGYGAPLAGLGLDEHDLRRLAQNLFAAARGQGLAIEEVARRTASQPAETSRAYRIAMCRLLVDTERRYAAAKQERGIVDTDDLLATTAALLHEPDLDLPARVAQRFSYLFVDEFQDTDRTQKEILDTFALELSAVLVVGDRKQSIYRFRAAQPSLLDEMAADHGVDVMPLNVSRRPTKQLLDAQNRLFQVVGERYPDVDEPLEAHEGTLVPASPPLPPFTIQPCGFGHEAQAEAVADRIRDLLGRPLKLANDGPVDEIRPGDIAILARANWLVDALAERVGQALAPDGIDVRADRGLAFYERPEIVATYRMLRLLVRHPDDAALSSALRTPYLAHGADPSDCERDLLQYGCHEGHPITDWFERTYSEENAALDELLLAARTETAPQLLGRLYDRFDIRRRYEQAGDFAGLAGLELLRERARELFDKEQALTLRIFTEWLGDAILRGYDLQDPAQAGSDEVTRPPYVRAMTIHRAKGLQFPIVVIPDIARRLIRDDLEPEFLFAEDGLDLGLNDDTRSCRWAERMVADREERLAEEVRIFYVGVTRAQQAVLLVGGKDWGPNSPDSEWYAWRDEVYRARSALGQDAEFRRPMS